VRTAEVLGTGERGRYLLAATFGNVHVDYVFHGSSGSSREELRAAIDHGVVKVNLDTDAQYAFTRAIAGHVLDHWDGILRVDGGIGDKSAYDPRACGRKAEGAMAARVAMAAEELGAAGRSLAAPRPARR
jgi:fructose-bisphosphate aldolase class II